MQHCHRSFSQQWSLPETTGFLLISHALQVWRQGEKVDALETWLLLEYCNSGSLDGAIQRASSTRALCCKKSAAGSPTCPPSGKLIIRTEHTQRLHRCCESSANKCAGVLKCHPVPRRTAEEMAAAMCFLHSKDIVHGDLCTLNVLLCSSASDRRGFVAKIADFGLARSASAAPLHAIPPFSPLH